VAWFGSSCGGVQSGNPETSTAFGAEAVAEAKSRSRPSQSLKKELSVISSPLKPGAAQTLPQKLNSKGQVGLPAKRKLHSSWIFF